MDKYPVRLTFLRRVGILFFLLGASTAQAVESPLALVRQTTERAMTALNNPSLQGEVHRQERREKFWKIVLPGFDSPEIAKRCLGPHWNELTASQQREFTDLFLELVKLSYQSTLDRQTNDAQFFFDQERIEGDSAEVDTRIVSPALEKEIAVNYRLHFSGGNWLIYDVIAENVSLVRNYRNQFARLLKDSSYEGLIQALRKKIQDSNA